MRIEPSGAAFAASAAHRAKVAQLAALAGVDREVRAHEQAHLAAAGGLARSVSFQFVTGPDGRQYAVAGEVSIDSSPVAGDPEKTIQKAQQIRAAANAPSQPSAQDRQVAAQAAQLEQAARQELAERQRREQAQAFEGPPDDEPERLLDALA
ncbi:MAG: hypothetical protein H6509_12325 [Bryobacterales bacterium]|nr:hypothetical protein [Acidobacteriota bacterium]MCB9385392.1 hypothetical protein [Bryobacterales bacterium]